MLPSAGSLPALRQHNDKKKIWSRFSHVLLNDKLLFVCLEQVKVILWDDVLVCSSSICVKMKWTESKEWAEIRKDVCLAEVQSIR